jgi:hypothetical protein
VDRSRNVPPFEFMILANIEQHGAHSVSSLPPDTHPYPPF